MSKDAYMTLLTCRAVRHFAETPLPEDALIRILQAGRWTESAKNIQLWQFVVVREKAALQRLADCGRYASHLKGGAATSRVIVAL